MMKTSAASPACTECHASKVKCVYDNNQRGLNPSCSRCGRLGLVCTPHVSRQGKRPRSTATATVSTPGARRKRRGDDVCDLLESQDGSEDAAISREVLTARASHQLQNASGNPHYGLLYLVRSWVSFAFRRRSFSLLSRAASMAVRWGISMDAILCEQTDRRGMDFLYPILLLPQEQQQVTGTPLQWSEIPASLLLATNASIAHARDSSAVQSRWIWIREMNRGVSRYYVTEAFAQNVASWQDLSTTYQRNENAVIDLFLSSEEKPKHLKAFVHQIFLHAGPDTAPRSSRMRGVQLKTRNGTATKTVEVDQVSCLVIADADRGYYYAEYVPQQQQDNGIVAPVASLRSNSITSNEGETEQQLEFDLLDLHGFDTDNELTFVLDLLK